MANEMQIKVASSDVNNNISAALKKIETNEYVTKRNKDNRYRVLLKDVTIYGDCATVCNELHKFNKMEAEAKHAKWSQSHPYGINAPKSPSSGWAIIASTGLTGFASFKLSESVYNSQNRLVGNSHGRRHFFAALTSAVTTAVSIGIGNRLEAGDASQSGKLVGGIGGFAWSAKKYNDRVKLADEAQLRKKFETRRDFDAKMRELAEKQKPSQVES